MIDDWKESRLLFLEEKRDWFIKGYEMKKAYRNDQNYSEEEGYNAFINKAFR
jgi:hypothetical protein